MNIKLMLVLSILSIIVLFSGCSSNITVGSHLLPDGTYRQTYVVNLDKKELATKYTNEEIAKIANVTLAYITNYCAKVDDDAKIFEIKNNYSGEHCVHKVTSSESENLITINSYILYSSLKFYNNFQKYLNNNISQDDSEESKTEIKKGLFYDKIIFTRTTNPLADKNSIMKVYDKIEIYLLSQGVDFKFDLKDINLCYDYAVPNDYAKVNRMRSNANKEYIQQEETQDGAYQMKHFVWKYQPNSDNEIVIYRYAINNYVWYISALILVVIFAVILWITHLLVRKYRKPKTENIENNLINENIENNNLKTVDKE